MDTPLEQLRKQAEGFFEKEQYKELIALFPDDVLEQNMDAVLYAYKGRAFNGLDLMEEAFAYANKAIEIDNKYYFPYRTRGNYFSSKGEHDKALIERNKAIEYNLGELNAVDYNNRGISWRNKRDYDKAIADYSKAIELKNDYSNAYYNRGIAWKNKGDYDKAIADYSKAIELKNDYSDAYNNRGIAWKNKGDYDKAIADYSKAIELKNDYSIAYNNRGNSWSDKRDYDKAIADYSKAIELKKDFSIAYSNRGNSWSDKGDYDKAIADYSKAIELKNDYKDAYNNRGIAWKNKGDYDKAIADYNKAIELKKDFSIAYNNRGNSWKNKGDDDKAIADYNKAIELKSDYALAYRNRGLLFEKQGKIQEAKTDYENAVKYNPYDAYAKSLLDKLFATLGKPVELGTDDVDETFYKIRKALDNVPAEDCIKIMKFYEDRINPVIEKIRAHAATTEKVWKEALGKKYKKTEAKYVAHYTSLKTADILIMKQPGTDSGTKKEILSPLRYSNAVFMNDPEEGAILISCLGKLESGDEKESTIVQAFERALKEEKTNFYIGSFLPMVKNHEDELLMWRTYGKDEHLNEAAGCCLLFDIDFFDKHDGKNIATRDDDKPVTASHPLFKVLYFDRRNNEFTGADGQAIETGVKELKDVLLELLKMKDGNEELNIAIDKVLYHSLSELRYFFKSSDYSYESELRVIQFATHADVVHIDETGTPPRKMYIESTKGIKPYLRKIVLGPKVQHPDRWAYLAEKMRRDGYDMEVSYSTCHFR